jgi:hypothetical protein
MRELTFSVRADHRAPTIAGGPADEARFTIAQPELAFTVGDDGAGVASVNASIDGRAVPVTGAGGVARITTGTLGLGTHVLAVTVVDGAGNATHLERHLTIADAAAPTLSFESPGTRGEATAWLSVRSHDDLSGVDPTTWLVSVNGEPVQIQADESHVTASLGPLAPGAQRIDVRVLDRAGNAATITRSYEVASAAVPSMPNIGARSGAFIVAAPRAAVTYGTRSSVSVLVSRNGRPVPGQMVELRRGNVVFGQAQTNRAGVARVAFRAGAPGVLRAWVAGTNLDPADVRLRVAPRLAMHAQVRRARIGQRVVLTGRIAPALRGRRLAVEARIGGTWYPIRRTAVTASDGTFRTTVASSSAGRIGVRMHLFAVGAWAPAHSNVQTLVVTAGPR